MNDKHRAHVVGLGRNERQAWEARPLAEGEGTIGKRRRQERPTHGTERTFRLVAAAMLLPPRFYSGQACFLYVNLLRLSAFRGRSAAAIVA